MFISTTFYVPVIRIINAKCIASKEVDFNLILPIRTHLNLSIIEELVEQILRTSYIECCMLYIVANASGVPEITSRFIYV